MRWKVILADVAQMLRGTEPMYTREETTDNMFRTRVSFRLPLDTSGARFTDIVVIGTKCSTPCEAENEASAAALKELRHGHLRMSIMDVSSARCKELESRCYEILGNAREVYAALRSGILTWEEDLNKVEFCYASTERKLAEGKCDAARTGYGDIDFEAAEQLAKMTSINYQKLVELTSEAEEMKDFIEGTHERIQYFFAEPATQTVILRSQTITVSAGDVFFNRFSSILRKIWTCMHMMKLCGNAFLVYLKNAVLVPQFPFVGNTKQTAVSEC